MTGSSINRVRQSDWSHTLGVVRVGGAHCDSQRSGLRGEPVVSEAPPPVLVRHFRPHAEKGARFGATGIASGCVFPKVDCPVVRLWVTTGKFLKSFQDDSHSRQPKSDANVSCRCPKVPGTFFKEISCTWPRIRDSRITEVAQSSGSEGYCPDEPGSVPNDRSACPSG